MYECVVCDRSFASIMSLTGHKRMHGPSDGISKKILCSCLITRKVIAYQYLEKYQKSLIGCKQCNKLIPNANKKTFCSQSCAASYNNTVHVKRKKKEKPVKIVRKKDLYRARKEGKKCCYCSSIQSQKVQCNIAFNKSKTY